MKLKLSNSSIIKTLILAFFLVSCSQKNDTRPIVWENSDFPGWRCSAGCIEEKTKDTIEFVQYALALDTYVHACAVYRKLNNLKHQGKSHQHYVDCFDDLFPDWYEEVNEGLLV